jgi:hypothetical protein
VTVLTVMFAVTSIGMSWMTQPTSTPPLLALAVNRTICCMNAAP